MYPFFCLLLVSLLLSQPAYSQSAPPDTQRTLQVTAGLLYTVERDQAYSPLAYRGVLPTVSLGYGVSRPRRTVRFWGGYGAGVLNNRFGAQAEVRTAYVFNYTLYARRRAETRGIRWGWSNHNVFRLRDYSDAANFMPRFDYHTSFGPAAGYELPFGGWLAGLKLSVVGHLQLVGFFLQSGYVSSAPDETLGADSGFGALLRSVRPLLPGRDWNWGAWSRLRYRLNAGTELGLAYRYDMTTLKAAHRSFYSQGNYLLTLTAQL